EQEHVLLPLAPVALVLASRSESGAAPLLWREWLWPE
ncbi:MAG: hypothetical protein ACI8UD_002718, partial [Planctomycetota bacterium]